MTEKCEYIERVFSNKNRDIRKVWDFLELKLIP